MKKFENQEIIFIFFGIFLLLIGIILNEYVLTALFSEDGIVAPLSRLKIWIFDGTSIGFGLLLVLSKSFRMFITNAYLVVIRICNKTIRNLMNNFSFITRSILIGISVLLLFMQMSYMVSAIYENQDNQGIIASIDPDAGSNIAITKKTTLFRGGNELHGVLYPRIAHYLAWLSPVFSNSDTENEKIEKKIHFSLVIISLFSMYCISFLLASIVSDGTLYKILGTLLISAMILSESTWCNYVLRVHPDMLLALFSALFLFFIYKWKSSNNLKYFYLVCVAGGACLSTKPVYLFFLPGLLFLEIPPVRIDLMKKVLKLYLGIALSYLVLAFPISVNVMNSISHLKKQSKFSLPPTWDSFLEWWSLLIQQAWLPLVMIVILFLFFSKSYRTNQGEKYLYFRLWAVAFVPFIFLLTRNVISGHDHYTMPFVSILLTATAFSLPCLTSGWIVRIRNWFSRDLMKYAMAIVMLLSVEATIGIIPDKVDEVLGGLIHREEVRATYRLINSYADSGKKVLVEAYIPFRDGHENIESGGHLKGTLGEFEKYNPDIVVVNSHQLPRIMEGKKPNDYMIISRENYEEIREYYGLFYNKSETVDPWGRKWVRTYEDLRGVQIWEKK